jgi:hypothetical protein
MASDAVQLVQSSAEEAKWRNHQVTDNMVELVLLGAAEGQQVDNFVQSSEAGVIQAVKDYRDRLRKLSKVLSKDRQQGVHRCLADGPATRVQALHCLAYITESVMQLTGVAATDDYSFCVRNSLAECRRALAGRRARGSAPT